MLKFEMTYGSRPCTPVKSAKRYSDTQGYLCTFIIYRRIGFKCEHVIIANCDFSPSTQLLERNVHLMYGCNQYVTRA